MSEQIIDKPSTYRLNFPGPAHGFARAAILLGMLITIKEDDVVLCSPEGFQVSLFCSQGPLLATIIKESARHSILEHLSERVNRTTSKPDRKDMKDITPRIDLAATLALINARLPKDEGGGPLLSTADKRVMQRIIAGSISAPDRLLKAKLTDSDECCNPNAAAPGAPPTMFFGNVTRTVQSAKNCGPPSTST